MPEIWTLFPDIPAGIVNSGNYFNFAFNSVAEPQSVPPDCHSILKV
jgi:hypothetical protein